MPRHQTVTDEFVDGLHAALRVRVAIPNEGLVNTGAYPYLEALRRVDQGWTRDKLTEALMAELGAQNLLGPLWLTRKGVSNRDFGDR